ncbi:peptidase M23 [Polymorphospora rubra]|uniref:peptidase M23 n=1 Tax=Polymorphospora rubra TaxID=338584 RepID=UPI00340B88C7
MRDDHTLETESGAAATTDRSAEAPSTDPASGVPTATRRTRQALGELLDRSTDTLYELIARSDRTVERLRVHTGARLTAVRNDPRLRALRRHPWVAAVLDNARVREQVGRHSPARLALAIGVICCLGIVAFAETRAATVERRLPSDVAAAQARADEVRSRAGQPASRSFERQPGADTSDTTSPAEPRDGAAAEQPAATDGEQAAPAEPVEAEAPAIPEQVAPVAGLSQIQMDNALAIVRAGHDLDMPRRAHIIAVATAMQESNLLNRASEVLPESKNYPHQGTGWDHDSVGLFQQRTSTGWGPVASLMDPAYSATQFYKALARVPGWDQMRLTVAAQTVQVSAYPEHYAKHEGNATAVVDAIISRS